MSKHLQRDLEGLKREILAMGSLVEEATGRAMRALLENDPDLARAVVKGDDRIDRKELEVEEDCLKLLALHQPVAGDLRFVVTVLKVNNDLERIGDLARNVAKRALALEREGGAEAPPELRPMMENVQSMVVRALDALVRLDAAVARQVLRDDEAVDRLHKKVFRDLQKRMARHPDRIRDYVGLLSVSRYLERIADLSTNVAEDVIFTVEGEVVRHGGWEERDGTEWADAPRLEVVPDPPAKPGSG